MGFVRPQLLLLLLLIPIGYRWLKLPGRPLHTALRFGLMALVVLCLAGPRIDLTRSGIDLIVIADRSLSVGNKGLESETELIGLLSTSPDRGDADRIAIIGFGSDAHVETRPTDGPVSAHLERPVDASASSLTDALMLAAHMRSPDRRTRVLLLSDGLYTGADPLGAEVLAELGDMPVWIRPVGRTGEFDVAAHSITLPSDVPEKAGFLVRFSIQGPAGAEVDYTLHRADVVLASGKTTLHGGVDHLFARDLADAPGAVEYTLDVSSPADTRVENDSCTALLDVVSAPRALVASSSPTPGLIVEALASAGVPVDTVDPASMDWSAARLAPYRLVVLENVPMEKLGHHRASALASAIDSGVSAMLLTGGEASFGQGGYHRSPIDPLLPVTMELREDQLRGVMAMVAVLDRSGSMAMPAGQGGKTKMDLANIGVAEAIRLLAPSDQVSVIAVDSSPHVIIPLAQADDTDKLIKAVLRIESMGGGIFVRTALDSAAEEVRKSELPTRHVILFSDAADSEEQEDSIAFARKLHAEGIDISVVGLGSKKDIDAKFLQDLASAGNGQVYFTDNASELPRIFSQEVIRIANRGFIKEPTRVAYLPDMVRLQLPIDGPPLELGGYNLVSLRRGASSAAMTGDDSKAPLVSFWRKGRAMVGTITAEVDGPYSGSFPEWPHAQELVVNLSRLLAAGVTAPDAKGYTTMSRSNAEVRVEVDEQMASQLRGSALSVRFLAPPGVDPIDVPVSWDTPTTMVARTSLSHPGHYLPVIDLGDAGVLQAPSVTLPYSPEFLPSSATGGEELLTALSEATGGQPLVKAGDAFIAEGTSAATAWLDVSHWLALLILLLLIAEIGVKRLF